MATSLVLLPSSVTKLAAWPLFSLRGSLEADPRLRIAGAVGGVGCALTVRSLCAGGSRFTAIPCNISSAASRATLVGDVLDTDLGVATSADGFASPNATWTMPADTAGPTADLLGATSCDVTRAEFAGPTVTGPISVDMRPAAKARHRLTVARMRVVTARAVMAAAFGLSMRRGDRRTDTSCLLQPLTRLDAHSFLVVRNGGDHARVVRIR